MKKQNNYTAEFKFKVALEACKEEDTVAELAVKYKTSSKNIHRWKKDLLTSGFEVFDKQKIKQKQKEELSEKEAEIEVLQKKVGELTIVNDWIKKKYKELGLQYKVPFSN